MTDIRKTYPALFKTIVGSHAYGTNIATSDVDYKGVYIQPDSDHVSFRYKEQMEFGKDETHYEIKRFIQLAASANPTILEMLFVDERFVHFTHPAFAFLRDMRHVFLTKMCAKSFGGYAVAQIQKARGLNKKFNWEKSKVERKTVLDFCFVHDDGKSVPVQQWLKHNKHKQEFCGLVALDRMPGCYALYYDHVADHLATSGPGARKIEGYGYSGIVAEDSNDVRLSSVPKHARVETVMSFNKEGYSMHCKDYREYQDWLKNRNEARYADIKNHDQKIDSKNLMHCRRLLDMALEIPTTRNIQVLRPNAEYLLEIRRGEHSLQEILEKAEADVKLLDSLYAESNLPDKIDFEIMNKLVLDTRFFYNEYSALNK